MLQANMDQSTVRVSPNVVKEVTMDIVYAAEKPSIAVVLSDHLQHRVGEQDIEVTDNPNETGSFLIQWHLYRYVMSPNGVVEPA